MNKRILIVTEYFYPSSNSTSYYITNIAKKFAENRDVQVVCNTNIGHYDELDIKNLSIVRTKEVKLSKNYTMLRVFKFLVASIKLSLLANKNIKNDTEVFSVTNPAFIIVFLAVLKKFKKFNYTLLVYDVFPENIIAAKILKDNSFLYKIVKTIYDWAYLKADRLIVIGRDMEEIIRKKTDNKVPIILIENWCDFNQIIPASKHENEILINLDIADKKIFLFAGNLGRVQGIQNMLKAAELVDNQDFALLFIGDGAMKQDIQQHINSSKKKNVLYAGSFSMSEQNIFLNACDVAIVSLADSMYGLGVPSKSYFNIAAAKPILYIGEERSEIARVISENNIGWVVENGNVEKLAQLFDNISSSSIDYNEFGMRARKVVEENFSQEIILNKYKELY